MLIQGIYTVECFDSFGIKKWKDTFSNLTTISGINLALDSFLSGANYTVVGPFIGLISSTNFSAISQNDTMMVHSGWLEAGNSYPPGYSGNRRTCSWNNASAGSKSLVSPVSFSFTSPGTIKGCFVVLGPGAISTIDDSNGILWSAGFFTAGDTWVNTGAVINVNYAAVASG